MRRTAALIAGGGPAGSAAAIRLAHNGARPLLIERTRETGDALCGGFLSWRTLQSLELLGLSADALGGHAVSRVRVFAEGRATEAHLPAPAIGLSRRRLDSLMLAAAARAGAGIERGTSISSAAAGSVALADGADIACDSLFLATGKHDCRGLPRPRPATDDPALGLRLRLPASPQLAKRVGDAIELHLFRGGYAGLVLQEDGSGNLCLAVRKSLLTESGGDAWHLLKTLASASPAFAGRMACADSSATINAIGSVPYGWRATAGVAGLFRLGDQAAVIPSLAGEGMGIAIASGMRSADAWLKQGPAAAIAFQRDLARRTAAPVRLASWLRNAAETRWSRRMAPALIGHMPRLLAWVAHHTRIES
ncbi:NAD(P)/FAD-dependent oxidoreductase [Sphingobium boeckii]|uniref:Flavin-dependent dehydrogenase n=1 Tax=Sphingobium boeckii TaxID=1082345 RepID=A0A7W9AEF7_9SPHN|nr:FAD-dependent monooxygenase [Sphingobium boeckii]MBB5684073.1 flavin-dependent dehydrogenase [Sphingobium boeckii]